MSEEPKILTAKETAAIEYYIEPTSETRNNWCKSYLRAGYSHCKGWKTNALRILAKDYIKKAIEAKRQEISKKIDVTREYLQEKLLNIIENGVNDRDRMTAISLIADFAGYKRELASNPEKEAEKVAKMTKEDKVLARITARQRTEELAGGHIKLNAG